MARRALGCRRRKTGGHVIRNVSANRSCARKGRRMAAIAVRGIQRVVVVDVA